MQVLFSWFTFGMKFLIGYFRSFIMNINWKILGLSLFSVAKYLTLYAIVVGLLVTLLEHMTVPVGAGLIILACTVALTYFEYTNRIKK